MTTWGAPDNDPPPGFQRLQAATDIPFIPTAGLHQLRMATQDAAFGAVVIRRSPPQDLLLKL